MNFYLVGSVPSSGSTLLADLLDSTSFSVCGEETKIFANKNIYRDFEYYKNNIDRGFKLSFLHSYGKIYFNFLHKYGLNLKEFKEILENSNSLKEFVIPIPIYPKTLI